MHLPTTLSLLSSLLISPSHALFIPSNSFSQTPMSPSLSTNPTIYFGYGSNLWLDQMHTRCPNSTYQGIARLSGYKWIINDRGYANVVEVGEKKEEARVPNGEEEMGSGDDEEYVQEDEVYGLVFTLTPADESRLDKNEGVPVAYTKEYLPCTFWASNVTHQVNTTHDAPTATNKSMLVYIDRTRVTPDVPRKEYVYRMNRGIADALRLGVPKMYVESVMRAYIPEERAGGGDEERRMEEFARGQAREFRDESGVFGS